MRCGHKRISSGSLILMVQIPLNGTFVPFLGTFGNEARQQPNGRFRLSRARGATPRPYGVCTLGFEPLVYAATASGDVVSARKPSRTFSKRRKAFFFALEKHEYKPLIEAPPCFSGQRSGVGGPDNDLRQ